MARECKGFQDENDKEALERDLTLIGVFALQDDLRPKIQNSVAYAQKGNIITRMVSGDHLETAVYTAIKAGILTEEESKMKNAVMNAEDFRKAVGGMRKELDERGNVKYVIQNKKEFLSIANRLRVLARAIPYDKHLLVVGLQDLNRAVAVTGDGINDVDAIRNGDVGFSMGSGCSVAKDASDMILISDNFESVTRAVMWGRNVYENVRRFLQFQITVNFSCLICVFASAVTQGDSFLGIVELLWINLIMDSFAALALATERPHGNIIRSPPVRQGDYILTKQHWRQIYGMVLYQVAIMIINLLFCSAIWGLKIADSTKTFSDGVATDWGKFVTILFNMFCYMQIFNFFNARIISPKAFNIFDHFFSNLYFVIIVLGLIVLQYLICSADHSALDIAKLTSE